MPSVRQQCVNRDGYCRFSGYQTLHEVGGCAGPSEWAHAAGRKRFETRGQPADVRHTAAGSFMACRRHHQRYDAHAFEVEFKTGRGADGPLRYVAAGRTAYEEPHGDD